jgi:eukaryotic-like serine/threonine-protein kinase
MRVSSLTSAGNGQPHGCDKVARPGIKRVWGAPQTSSVAIKANHGASSHAKVDVRDCAGSDGLGGVVQQLGPYRVVRRVGSGASGVVYEAIDDRRSLRVALKTLTTAVPASVGRLKSEFRNVASVHHPNLVRLYELMESDGVPFFTMELLDGRSLADHFAAGTLAKPRGDAWFAALRSVALQLALGLDALHRHSLIHLDVKPANILVEPGGRAVLLDFGIACRGEGGAIRSRASMQGTPRYMAPEQLVGDVISPASDWYALGLILYELLAEHPARGDDPWESLEEAEIAMRPSAHRTDVPPDLDTLCADMLQRDAARRPAGSTVIARLGGGDRMATPDAPRVLIGRGAQQQVLRVAEQAVAAGAAPIVVHVVGAGGAGKSALVADFLARERATPGTAVLAGRCYEWESLPYKGLDAVVDGLCDLLAALPPRERERLPLEELREVGVLFPVLRRLWGHSSAERPTELAERSERRAHAFRSFKRMLRAIAERTPILCFIDDAQWGDADSARLLLEVLLPPDPPRMLLVLAYRDGELRSGDFLAELEQARDLRTAVLVEHRIALDPLPEHHAVELARNLLGGLGEPTQWAAIAREAEGNPFFIEELARHGNAIRDRSRSRLTLDDVVHGRINQLSEDARRVLRVIAVAGRLEEQDLALAAAGAPGDPHRVLAELRAASLIRTRGPRSTDTVELYHDRIRECVVGRLATPILMSVHQSLASTLEGHPGIEPQVLSTHFEGAGNRVKARGYALEAAAVADAALAFDRAAMLYQRALSLGDGDAPDVAHLQEQRGRALWNAGRGAQAAPAYLAAAARTEGHAARELRRQAVEAYLVAGRLREGIATLAPLAAEAGLPYHASNARSMLSVVTQLVRLRFGGVRRTSPVRRPASALRFEIDLCWAIGRGLGNVHPAQGVDFLLRGLRRAISLGEPRRLARALTVQGSALVTMGGAMGSLGEQCLARATELSVETGDPYLRAILLVFRGFSEVAGAGRWPIAIAQAEEGIQILRQQCTGASWEMDMGMSVKLKALEPAGEVRSLGDMAIAWARDAVDRGDLYSQNVAVSFVVPYRLALGDVEEARRCARQPLADWINTGYTVQHYHATRLEAHCDLYAGCPADALRRLHDDQPRMKKIHLYRLTLSRIEARVLEAVIRLSLAVQGIDKEKHLKSVLRLAARLEPESRSDGKPHAAMIRGCAMAVVGERDRSIDALRDAQVRYERAAMPQWSQAVARRVAELEHDATTITAIDAWFAARGVAEPERWVAQLLPRVHAAHTNA